jgi:hypothetical protein
VNKATYGGRCGAHLGAVGGSDPQDCPRRPELAGTGNHPWQMETYGGVEHVVIELRSPTAAAAQALYDAYSADWITVSPEPYTQKLFLCNPLAGDIFRPGQEPSDP